MTAQIRRPSRRTARALTVGTALAAAAGLAPAASAETAPSNCPRGFVCLYSEANMKGRLLLRTDRDWTGNIAGVGSAFNNGAPQTGYDHAYILHWVPGTPGHTTRCLHYNPGPGHTVGYLGYVKSIKWGGECPN